MSPLSAQSTLDTVTGLLPLSTTTTCADPQAVYNELRARYGQVAPVELEPGIHAWLVLGHKEICEVTRNERLFSRDPNHWRLLNEGRVPPTSGLGPMMFPRDNAYFADGDKHRRLRAPLDDGLASLNQHAMSVSIRSICEQLLDDVAHTGRADLVNDYAAQIPMLAVARMFGLDMARSQELRKALIALFGSGDDSQEGNANLERILTEVIAERRAEPKNDLTSAFLRHENLHNDFEIQQSMVLMISAGYETTTTWICQALRLMLTDPRFAARLRGGRVGIDDALDEVLWRDPPMSNMPARYALHHTNLSGTSILRGDALILGFAAANADPSVRSNDPWLEFGNRAHLAWSAGPHTCPADTPARLITRIAVDTALQELHDVAMDVAADQIPLLPSPWTRCPASLPVRFTPDTTTRRLAGENS
ncbi:cytochrome [Saccharomonospora piscinae]|uniref:Cytochrome n=1 Tax=Saccharomonospora piscinae TaxID=687388 RepID=A0A1V9A8Z0_SACPI|nr:cytochrome P450 [Saccharomonospora piscinae]OQO93602.1 cytochrome [Saccharomonospora piscinae]TLW94765.1 cytochrome P450 [Saccharomonospora piscinae]